MSNQVCCQVQSTCFVIQFSNQVQVSPVQLKYQVSLVKFSSEISLQVYDTFVKTEKNMRSPENMF
jgi:hypothetical protein